jgi:hypothetical protein
MTIHQYDVENYSISSKHFYPGNFTTILLNVAIILCREPVEFRTNSVRFKLWCYSSGYMGIFQLVAIIHVFRPEF